MKGTRAIIEVLKSEGVTLAFAYPGGQVIPLFDELYGEKDIRIILPRHEQGGVHAAEGYARVTGRVGVVIATSGPGATNLVTGIADANMDSIPLVAITGQVPTHLIGNDAFQEVDVLGVTRSVAKHNYLVSRAEELPFMLKAAFYIARTGRPGPVVVDIPSNIQRADFAAHIPESVNIPSYQPKYDGNPRQIERIANLINASERPVFYVGGGVISSESSDYLRQAASKANIPVTTTLMGLGAIPTDHPLSLGMLGMHGTAYANLAVTNCDLLVAVGARFDDRITGKLAAFAPVAKIIHIDIDPTSVSKSVRVDLPVIGSAFNILRDLLPQLEHRERKDWFARIDAWRLASPLVVPAGNGRVSPQALIRSLYSLAAGKDPVLCTDVGQHQMWSALFWNHQKPRRWVSSGGFGTMGFGLPAAIGAQLGLPDNLVLCVTGDGGFQMNIQEMATVARLNLPIKIILMNNGYLGMVRQWQELFWDHHYSHTDISDNPDFTKVSEAFGVKAFVLDRPADTEKVLAAALNHPGPALVNAMIEREANVYPMVPAGEPLDNLILDAE
ncbi:MAG: biosynthetic-type acetolactate synthase large subunit [Planctomycetota bacterium]|jgi:acetolactate synthase-1/2/3 large subunit|nr:biosynthetic-type acetolactate synthase large subunit [Planctomycetota bacterium]